MSIVSAVLSTIFVMSILHGVYTSAVSVMAAIVIVGLGLVLISTVPTPLRQRVNNIEKRFISNINERENRRTGHENNLVSDLHLAYMTVGHECPFVGDRLRNLDSRTRYGVNLVNIQRGNRLHPVPSGDMRIFPGDILGVIGTEEQIQRMLPLVEAQNKQGESPNNHEVKFIHFAIGEHSPIIGVPLEQTRLRLRQADEELDKLVGTRTRAIERKLRSVEALDGRDTDEVLGISEAFYGNDED
jgi:CPA2 family monovalent cation:H+ antiporter-2